MPSLKTYNLFISHAWDYNDEYYKLVDFLRKATYFQWKNYSVPEHDPLKVKTNKQLEDALREQIRHTNVVIILAGMYVKYRKWIQKEIDIANEMGKPIIGIKPWGQTKVPTEVTISAKEVVGWNTSSIVEAIRKYAK